MASDAKKLKQLTAQRQTEIIKLKEIEKIANDALNNKTSQHNFKCRYKYLDEIKENFEKSHASIISIISIQDNGDLDSQNEIYTEFDVSFFHIQSVHSQIFEGDDSLANDSQTNLTSNSKFCNVKLPQLSVPIFSGDYKHWQTFIDMFDSMVHTNDSLSNIDKFNYLLTSVSGPAYDIVVSIPLRGTNYNIAYNRLRKRYDKKLLIARSHWHEILNAPKVERASDFESLRNLIDTFERNLAILENLNYKIDQWDFILYNMLFDRLDGETKTRFELKHHDSLPDNEYYATLLTFLTNQCDAIDSVVLAEYREEPLAGASFSPKKFTNKDKHFKTTQSKIKSSSALLSHPEATSCPVCQQHHLIYSCPQFIAKSPKERFDFIKSKKWCSNCLGYKHTFYNCPSQTTCRKCSRKHHTLLHFDGSSQNPKPTSQADVNATPSTSQFTGVAHEQSSNIISQAPSTVVLCTAMAEVLDNFGNFQSVRVLLDSGSQSNFITNKCCSRLGLPKKPLSLEIRGVGNTKSKASHEISCLLKPHSSDKPILNLDLVVLPQICADMPSITIPEHHLSQYFKLSLADPQFNVSRPIDILLGADIFSSILKPGQTQVTPHSPTAIDTIFGWIIMGRVNCQPEKTSHSLLTLSNLTLENQVKKFWELDSVPTKNILSPEDQLAEDIFMRSVHLSSSNKFTVSLPFKDEAPEFPGSKEIALKRFLSLERKLVRDPMLYRQYKEFMQEYLDLQHMEKVQNNSNSSFSYYIPHFAVIKDDETKFRVVFDASAKCSNNLSLNDTLLPGTKLQNDIVALLLRFRLHKIAITADIKKMFRQIFITSDHRRYQCILWRFSNSDPIEEFQLNTVTYGVSSSPYLAIRTINHLASLYRNQYPEASQMLTENLYVDDLLGGCTTTDAAYKLYSDLMKLMAKGGFELRKWASNDRQFLSKLPSSLLQSDCLTHDFDSDYSFKILGLQWNPQKDHFCYKVQTLDHPCTKRNMLSELARIFDPIGFLSPVTLYLKLLIQLLWTLGLDWDAKPPKIVSEPWNKFKEQLPALASIQIPRYTLGHSPTSLSLHGFSDASEKAYSAVVFLRVEDTSQTISTFLMASKTRVAPLKKISIPRLELCGALLLSDLMHYVQNTLMQCIVIDKIAAYTDSIIVLSWIRASPHKWTTFVSNRVTQIQEKLPPSVWNHVPSDENPADPASRGLFPKELIENKSWWHGPYWLQKPYHSWPLNTMDHAVTEVTEELRPTALLIAVDNNPIDTLLSRFSSLKKIKHIVCYILRFINNSRRPSQGVYSSWTKSDMENALKCLIKITQAQYFCDEITLIRKHRPLPKWLRKLNPILDNEGIFRVGGRLVHSKLMFDEKHPILLPWNCRLTQLLIEDYHNRYLHPGKQTLLSFLRQKFWILSPRKAIDKATSRCMKCFRSNPTSIQPPMGDLPSVRVSQIKPFTAVGVDYGGPFQITLGRTRGAKSQKAYIALFVCMATKAVHLELVSSLDTDSFLAALRRLISRRGAVSHIYSDCGTNFVGASKLLNNAFKNAAEHELIQWHFNPPSSPNFGGLWEAGIKAVKTHLVRIVGDQILTFEEFYTVLVQIEAVLNSRPLSPLSSDPSDLTPLTPAHFLTLGPICAPPEDDLSTLKLSRLSRWQLVQRFQQDFWARWHREYLHTLQQRSKWTQRTTNIALNSLVLLKDENLPPLKWSLGRIVEIHPGADNIIRVVTVRTVRGVFKRPVSKVCPLPSD